MAAKLEGGAYLSSFVDAVLNKLSSLDVNSTPMAMKLADQNFFQRLKLSLRAVRPVLDDAEQKQIRDDQEVKKWLVDLQDALYMADDLLDELSTKAATAATDPGNNFSCWSFAVDSILEDSFDGEIGVVINKLESIVEEKNGLCLKEEPVKDLEDLSWRIQSSLVESSDIVGRDDDKEAILELLLDDTCDANKISVIPIVGMGGVGKTTLAQLVYNDARVEEKFDTRAWVCVSDQFDIVRVTKTLIEAAAGGSSYNGNDLGLLQNELKGKLIGKKFLIVLDDLWIDSSNSRQWKSLQKPFQYGKKGSKVLVTTRNDTTADVVRTIKSYHLSLLPEKDCWSLFVKHVFLSPESKEYSTLEPVGRELVKKCKGLPLAVESLGALLRTNCEERDWDSILESELWKVFEDQNDEIIPALSMSYHYLPSNLKRCFVYCSLFPKDYQFDKDELVLLWMAEELLQPKGKKDLEEIGSEYFNQLVARSFFQSSSANNSFYVIHDLMHDLATTHAGEFYFRAEKLEENIGINYKTRHLLHNARGNYPFSQFVTACGEIKDARTFLEINLGQKDPFNVENAPHIFLSHLKCLRVLSFNTFYIDSLPDSIGNLIHLRYLDLSNTRMETLPEELCFLYNLQTLKLNNCQLLKKLPSNMKDLVNLRHLDIRQSGIEEMPKGMSKLKYLHFLSDYVVGKHADNGIKELGALTNIRESLHICQLENVMDGAEALEARIADKEHITGLNLTWSSNSHSYIDDCQDILNNLRPHTNLRELSIEEYKGLKFPNWLGRSSYKNMTKLYLYGCSDCLELPSLGQLPSLKCLRLSNFRRLQRVGANFYKEDGSSSGGTAFPVLEILSFEGMYCWEEWLSGSSELDAFPLLRELSLRNCRALRGDLPSQLPALKNLLIDHCGRLGFSLPRTNALLKLSVEGTQQVEVALKAIAHNQLNCLQSLSITSFGSATSFPVDSMPDSLQDLLINDCPWLEFPMPQQRHESLQSISIWSSCFSLTSFPLPNFPNLTTLSISWCIYLRSFVASDPTASTSASSLRSLTIESCPSLESFPNAPHLEYLLIRKCPEIESFFEGGLPPNLRELQIQHCEKLVKYLASMDLLDHYLTLLDIQHPYDNIQFFPMGGSLPASLETLNLRSFPSLEILDCKGLDHLQRLLIEDCPRMQDVAGKSFPASMSMLCFNGPSLLRERFQTNDELILSKMSHVGNIRVDGGWIFLKKGEST